MNIEIIPTPSFLKSVKRLLKKHKRLISDLDVLSKELKLAENSAIDLGHNCFKIRVANSSVPTGKSCGFRVIYFQKVQNDIYLLDIYSKTDLQNIDDNKLRQLVKDNGLNA